MPQQLFVFIQLEFPWVLGPADGRYLLRNPDGEPERVVVLGALEAGRQPLGRPAAGRSRPRLRRPRKRMRSMPTGPEPAPVDTTRVTVIDPISLAADNQARAWLAELDRGREVGAAVAVINRVIHAHRIASADPCIHEVSPAQALVIRAGWGEGEQVADGRWLHARALVSTGAWDRRPAGAQRRPGRDRSWALRIQERFAALLSTRDAALMCEEITLRARQDLDHRRLAHAALELDRAFALAPVELRNERRQDLAIRIAELEQLRPGVHAQASAVLPADGQATPSEGPGDAPSKGPGDAPSKGPGDAPSEGPDESVVTHALERLEAALRARTAAGL